MYSISISIIQLYVVLRNKQNTKNIKFFIRNFLAYDWGMEAFRIAHDRMVKGKKDLLIVILKEKINVDRLPADLRVYISKY